MSIFYPRRSEGKKRRCTGEELDAGELINSDTLH